MKKVFLSLLVFLVIFTMISTVLAETCTVNTNANRPNHPEKKCGKTFGDPWTEISITYNGSHYAYDQYGNQYNCHYHFNKVVEKKKCKAGHVKVIRQYVNSFGHDCIYCPEH